jgi:hypothetical protein
VRAALVRDFGREVSPAAGAGGHDVTVPVPATVDSAEGGERQRGWELAHWAVANSSALHIERVSYAGRDWTAGDAGGTWSGAVAQAAAGAEKGLREVRIVTAQ